MGKFKTNSVRVAHGSNLSKPQYERERRKSINNLSTRVSNSATAQRARSCSDDSTTMGLYNIGDRFNFTEEELYERMCEYVMTPEQLDENGYPRPGDEAGQCVFKHAEAKTPSNSEKKICRRCGK